MSEQSFESMQRVLGAILLIGLTCCVLALMLGFLWWLFTGGLTRFFRSML